MHKVLFLSALLIALFAVSASQQFLKIKLRRELIKINPRNRNADTDASTIVRPAISIGGRKRLVGRVRKIKAETESDKKSKGRGLVQINKKSPYDTESDFERNNGVGRIRPMRPGKVMLFQDSAKVNSDQYYIEVPPALPRPIRVAKNIKSPYFD